MPIKLSFLGATRNVTGSRYLLQTENLNILVDCGLYQERQFLERNWDKFPIRAGAVDAVILTHAHLDHCGWLPKLAKEGFNGRIYCTDATAEIAKIVLLDAGHLQEEDVEFKRKRHKREGRKSPRPVEPLYTAEDAENCFSLFAPVKYEQPIQLGDDIEATLFDAGHILGASIIRITVNIDGQKRTIMFTGDLGTGDRPILNDPTVFEQADYCLVESTYGDRTHESFPDTKEKLADAINTTKEAGGNVVIPSFSVERSQEVLYYLNELLLEDKIPDIMTFLDSPMAIRVTEVFKQHPEMFDDEMIKLLQNHESPFSFDGLKMTKSTKESKAINGIRGTVIIIAGSGMCTGGRVKHHLVNNISRPESTILFVGYQAQGTLGRRILNGEEEVRILGQMYQVKARVIRINGFSAHADREQIYNWLSNIKKPPRKIFVVHGEENASESFAEFLKEKTDWDICVPEYGEQVTLD